VKEDDDGAYVKEMRIAYRILSRKLEWNRSFGRSRRRSEEDIRMWLSEIGSTILTGSMWLRIGIKFIVL
jgi:hypothetical protein